MTSTFLTIAVALVRTWTRVYTWKLDPNVRDERRAEIDSDIWEQVHAPDAGATVAFEILGRLLLGMHADLHWRLEHGAPLVSARRVLLATIASAAVVLMVWAVMFFGRTRTLPHTIPSPPPMRVVRGDVLPPPPPPPPPLCAPGAPPQANCTRWPQ
jgi:hypothetical protein